MNDATPTQTISAHDFWTTNRFSLEIQYRRYVREIHVCCFWYRVYLVGLGCVGLLVNFQMIDFAKAVG